MLAFAFYPTDPSKYCYSYEEASTHLRKCVEASSLESICSFTPILIGLAFYFSSFCQNRAPMMKRVLLEDFEKCTGCRVCELVCSLYHENEVNPSRSRIHIIKWEEEGIDVPVFCQQCEEPLCKAVCPLKAISRDIKTGAVVIDYSKCVGCRLCVYVCPFGGITLDPISHKAIKCDLCGGDPKCTRFCATGALKYVSFNELAFIKKREAAKKLSRLVEKLLIAPIK